jgi:hypothetical protein
MRKVQNTCDRWDEIHVTPQVPRSACPGHSGRYQIGECHQVRDSEAGPPAGNAEVGVGRHPIRPIDRHGAQPTVGVLERDAILSPERLGDDEPERLPPEGVKRVRDPNLRWIGGIGGS